MRISDWSSDVCSSDLQWSGGLIRHNIHKEDVRFDAESLGNLVKPIDTYAVLSPLQSAHISPVDSSDIGQSPLREPAGRSQHPKFFARLSLLVIGHDGRHCRAILQHRKSVVSGKSVSVRVDLGAPRIPQK